MNQSPTLAESDAPANQPATDAGRLGVGEKVGYGLGDMASNLYWKTFEFFLPYFYTDVFGISARAVGTMMLVTRIWDAINDPLVGYLADRTRTSWGRFRPYLVWMCVPFAITGILTFYTPDLEPSGKLVYAYVTYTLVMMAYTAINIPYGALLGVISADSLQRTSVSTYRFVAAFLGGVIVQYGTLRLVSLFGGTETVDVDGVAKEVVLNERAGFFWTMLLFSVLAVVLFLVTFVTTRERVQPKLELTSTFRSDLQFLLTDLKLHQIGLLGLAALICLSTGFDRRVIGWVLVGYAIGTLLSLTVRRIAIARLAGRQLEPSTLRNDFYDLLANRPWMVLFGYGLFQLMGAFVRGGVILYYFKYYCGDSGQVPTFLVAGSIAAIAGMLLTKRLTAWIGKKWLMVVVNVGVSLLTAAFFLLEPDQIGWMFGLYILGSFIGGPSPVILWAMYADAADYSEWRTNRRATGLVFSAATFSQKMGCAVGAAMTGFALDFYEYVPPIDGIEQPQSETTLWGIRLMMSLIPAGFFLLAAVCVCFYGISEQLLEQIQADRQQSEADSARAT